MNDKVCKAFDFVGKRLFLGDSVLVVSDEDDIDTEWYSGDGQRGTVDSICIGRIVSYGHEMKRHDVHVTLNCGCEVTGYSREFLKLN